MYRVDGFYSTPRDMAVSHALWIRTDEGDDVVLLVSSRWRLHRWTCAVHVGERIGQGQRCGFGMLISRVDVMLPRPVRVEVGRHDRLRAGSDVIATLRHRPA
jgi:phosphatidylserine decarboxylase